MGESFLISEINNLRNDFKLYLKTTNKELTTTSILNYSCDAFYLYNNGLQNKFWSSFVDEESLLLSKNILKTLDKKNSSDKIDNYFEAMKYFKEFLNLTHPTLAREWSNKNIEQCDTSNAFRQWMKKQKKLDGGLYAKNTISTYSSVLKNSTSKLKLEEKVKDNIFDYTYIDDFEKDYKIILNAENFEEIDIANKNKAYSNGVALYLRFLKDFSEAKCWIFQGNPKFYKVIDAVNDLDRMVWAVNQNKNQIKKGDKVYIWVSGADGGIIASGIIEDNPNIMENNLDDKYKLEQLNEEAYLGVTIKIYKKYIRSPVKRTILLADERTKDLQILKYPGATNFLVIKEEEIVIESIIEGNYKNENLIHYNKPHEDSAKVKYWLYSPGEGSKMWEEFQQRNIMGIEWDEMGNLKTFVSKESMKEKMKTIYGEENSYMNQAHATWQFANEINIGDIIYAKKGISKIVGRGIVESEYIFDDSRNKYKNIRNVKWVNIGEWEHPGRACK